MPMISLSDLSVELEPSDPRTMPSTLPSLSNRISADSGVSDMTVSSAVSIGLELTSVTLA